MWHYQMSFNQSRLGQLFENVEAAGWHETALVHCPPGEFFKCVGRLKKHQLISFDHFFQFEKAHQRPDYSQRIVRNHSVKIKTHFQRREFFIFHLTVSSLISVYFTLTNHRCHTQLGLAKLASRQPIDGLVESREQPCSAQH